jgi:hypothetical protein
VFVSISNISRFHSYPMHHSFLIYPNPRVKYSPSHTHEITPFIHIYYTRTVQKAATQERSSPLRAVANISAPHANSVGTDPPTPTPASTRREMRKARPTGVAGQRAQRAPATALGREGSRQTYNVVRNSIFPVHYTILFSLLIYSYPPPAHLR